MSHDHDHEHDHGDGAGHDHHHDHAAPQPATGLDPARHRPGEPCLVIRPNSGLSGDMLLAGLARMAGATTTELGDIAASLGLPRDCVVLEEKSVNTIGGWHARIALPHEHSHRTLSDVKAVIARSGLSARARALADRAFTILAVAEGHVHGIAPEAVTFHEVGALDSILDTCLVTALYDRLGAPRLVSGPLPLCDGMVRCAHGLLPTPAPAVLDMLEGIPVRGLASRGETVTPTALSLLRALDAEFGDWPEIVVQRRALVYGTRVLPGVANGAIFALGPQSGRAGR
ncbi:MAG: nickel insertion protein [Pseudomonadota bacterium]|nr:nickel insertion protein [Pseudomonadota bacterium]